MKTLLALVIGFTSVTAHAQFTVSAPETGPKALFKHVCDDGKVSVIVDSNQGLEIVLADFDLNGQKINGSDKTSCSGQPGAIGEMGRRTTDIVCDISTSAGATQLKLKTIYGDGRLMENSLTGSNSVCQKITL